jgi:hypothetical protein
VPSKRQGELSRRRKRAGKGEESGYLTKEGTEILDQQDPPESSPLTVAVAVFGPEVSEACFFEE